jgi:hypothetical protein
MLTIFDPLPDGKFPWWAVCTDGSAGLLAPFRGMMFTAAADVLDVRPNGEDMEKLWVWSRAVVQMFHSGTTVTMIVTRGS